MQKAEMTKLRNSTIWR